MPIVNMRELMKYASSRDCAVGAFNVFSIESVRGVILAAEELHAPVIIQVAEMRLETTPLALLGRVMLKAAEDAHVPVAVHLDHGLSELCIRQALDMGFTSVMYDGSPLPLKKNIENTLRVMGWARATGAAVEAEIGRVGRGEAGEECEAVCADPDEAARFARETGVDALAVGIGNAHGVYAGAPHLRFDVLKRIRDLCATPLVLHGGTGISDDDFRRSARLGVRKINIGTALFLAAFRAAKEGDSCFDISRRATANIRAEVERLIGVFGMDTEGRNG